MDLTYEMKLPLSYLKKRLKKFSNQIPRGFSVTKFMNSQSHKLHFFNTDEMKTWIIICVERSDTNYHDPHSEAPACNMCKSNENSISKGYYVVGGAVVCSECENEIHLSFTEKFSKFIDDISYEEWDELTDPKFPITSGLCLCDDTHESNEIIQITDVQGYGICVDCLIDDNSCRKKRSPSVCQVSAKDA